MPVTLTKIAEEAGVSVSLVSRLLRGDRTLRVSEETRRRVVATKRKLGGVRRTTGARQQFVRKQTQNIVVPINRIFSPSWIQDYMSTSVVGQFLRQFEATLSAERFRMSITFVDEQRKLEELTTLVETPDYCDGLLLLTSMADPAVARMLLDHTFPHVSGEEEDERFGINTVCGHHSDSVTQLIEHLTSLGHQRIGFVGSTKVDRYGHYLSSMAMRGLAVRPEMICAAPMREPDQSDDQWLGALRQRVVEHLSANADAATALLCNNDRVALVLIDQIRARGLRVPDDISVAGFDNSEVRGPNPSPNPILTTIDNPQELIGQRCAERLMEQVRRKSSTVVHERIRTQLIVRQTTGPVKM